ncbi:MAG TPA: hypothetical protein VLB04_02620 [Methanotrichaceae archaeon]|nr:hypothetical protein [Methanotrichaceae archaeon]
MMKFDNLLISLAMLAILSATAVYGDPLNPGMLGEGMDMPLPPDLIQKAVKAGVITSASQVTGPLPSGSQPMNLGTPAADSLGTSASLADAGTDATTTDATGTAGPVNAGPIASQAAGAELNLSGTISLVLKDSLTRYLNLALVQNGNAVAGQGDLTAGGSTQEVAANGLVAGGTLNLTVTPAGSSDLYRLDLRPDGNTLKGSYSIQSSASGETISGTAVGVMSNPNANPNPNPNAANVGSAPSNPAVQVGGAGASSSTSAMAGPVQLGQSMGGGSSFSSSKSISMSASGGGSMVSSTSSTSF